MTVHCALAAADTGRSVASPSPRTPGAAAGEAAPAFPPAPAFLPALELLLLALLLRLFGRTELPARWRPFRRTTEAFAPWLVGSFFLPESDDAPPGRPSAALRRARRLAAWAGWIMRFFPARGMRPAAPAPIPLPPPSARAPPRRPAFLR